MTALISHSTDKDRGGEEGFTLVELMVVIVIIGLLATVVLINVVPALSKSAVTKAKADISTLEQGLEMYRLNNMRYPTGDQGLQTLVADGYVKRLPNDPWGNPYVYKQPGEKDPYEIRSLGSDGQEGGTGTAGDITSAAK